MPYSEGLQGWIDMARAAGHEVLLETPMEPKDYPDNDPGPYTLLADGAPQETTRRLEWVLSRATGYFGVTNYLGSRVRCLARRDGRLRDRPARSGASPSSTTARPRTSAAAFRAPRPTAWSTTSSTAPAIEAQLTALETQAQRSGQALGSGFAYPVTLAEAPALGARAGEPRRPARALPRR